MTKGLTRIYGRGHLHFITFSTYGRQPTLTPKCRDHILEQLELLRQEKQFQIAGYVVMPEHVHALIGEPKIGDPTSVMQVWKQRYALTFNREDRVKGRQFWLPRFYDFNVFTHKKRVEKIHYMHNNPVTRGLVEAAKDWKWSSYAFYINGTKGPVLIDPS